MKTKVIKFKIAIINFNTALSARTLARSQIRQHYKIAKKVPDGPLPK